MYTLSLCHFINQCHPNKFDNNNNKINGISNILKGEELMIVIWKLELRRMAEEVKKQAMLGALDRGVEWAGGGGT